MTLRCLVTSTLLCLATTVRSVSPTNTSDCLYPTKWLTQKINHNGTSNGTFQQRYRISTDFYQPGGPILLFQGEETSSLDCLESTIFYDFAKDVGGIVAAIEHRYFGASKPFGMNLSSYTHKQWSQLNLDNVMADAVSFADMIKRNYTAGQDPPVLVSSGSYGGFLMTMFRQNHPEAFDGVIASAPPIRSFYGGNQTVTPGQYNWWNYVANVYRQYSSEASVKIGQAFDVLTERFNTNNISGLNKELNLCAPLPDNSTSTFQTVVSWFIQVLGNAAEYNYNSVQPGRNPFANPLQKMVDIVLEEEDPLQILNRTNQLWNSNNAAVANIPFSCNDITDFNLLSVLAVPLGETLPFGYITCSYVTFEISSRSPNTGIFPPSGPTAAINAGSKQYCLETYGVWSPPSEEMYRRYHFTDAELANSTGIIFSLGQWDPTTAVSGLYDFILPMRADPYASRRIFTTGMAHREDLYSQNANTKASVRVTNAVELQVLKDWSLVKQARHGK